MTISGSGYDGFSCTRNLAAQALYACAAGSRGRRLRKWWIRYQEHGEAGLQEILLSTATIHKTLELIGKPILNDKRALQKTSHRVQPAHTR